MAEKRVYFFGGGKADGNAKMKELLGGKGANLAEMTNPGGIEMLQMCLRMNYMKGKKRWQDS